MLISYQKLAKLPVITESGVNLGKICDLDLDPENLSIINLYVKSFNLVKGLFEDKLIIKKQDILKITDKVIIVKNNSLKKIEKNKAFLIKTSKNKALVNTN